jgi:hypothetical protein
MLRFGAISNFAEVQNFFAKAPAQTNFGDMTMVDKSRMMLVNYKE